MLSTTLHLPPDPTTNSVAKPIQSTRQQPANPCHCSAAKILVFESGKFLVFEFVAFEFGVALQRQPFHSATVALAAAFKYHNPSLATLFVVGRSAILFDVPLSFNVRAESTPQLSCTQLKAEGQVTLVCVGCGVVCQQKRQHAVGGAGQSALHVDLCLYGALFPHPDISFFAGRPSSTLTLSVWSTLTRFRSHCVDCAGEETASDIGDGGAGRHRPNLLTN